jgi:hypothetical protein
MSLTGTTSNGHPIATGYQNQNSTNGGEYGFQGITNPSITIANSGGGLTPNGNYSIMYGPINTNTMALKQVNVAVFTITRDEDTNEINSTKFVKELWIEQKNGASIDLIVAKQLDKDFDPEFTIIKTLATFSF